MWPNILQKNGQKTWPNNSQKDRNMVLSHIKRCLILFTTWQMQIKKSLRYHFLLIGLTKIQKLVNTLYREIIGFTYFWWKCVKKKKRFHSKGTTLIEENLGVCNKWHAFALQPYNFDNIKIYTHSFNARLFVIAEYLTKGDWLNNYHTYKPYT